MRRLAAKEIPRLGPSSGCAYLRELAVAISEDHRALHGVIPLADISTAMRTLQWNCLK